MILTKLVKYSYNTRTDFENLYKCIHNTNIEEVSNNCNHTMYNPLINLARYHEYKDSCLYINLLIEKNFNIMNQDHEGNTILHHVHKKPELLISLLFHKDYKKCLLIKNKQGNLPIHSAAYRSDDVNLVIFIQNSISDVFYLKNNEGYTVYDIIKHRDNFFIKENILKLINPDLINLNILYLYFINKDIASIVVKYI